MQPPQSAAVWGWLACQITAGMARQSKLTCSFAGGGNGVVWALNVSAPNPAATAKPVHFIAGEGEDEVVCRRGMARAGALLALRLCSLACRTKAHAHL